MLRQGLFSAEAYRTFSDMIEHATNPEIPIAHTQWESCGNPIVESRLFEIADIQAWTSPIHRLDSRAIRAPCELRRGSLAELNRLGWKLARQAIPLWLWRAAKKEISPRMGEIAARGLRIGRISDGPYLRSVRIVLTQRRFRSSTSTYVLVSDFRNFPNKWQIRPNATPYRWRRWA